MPNVDAAEPRTELVLLEPRDHATLAVDRARLIEQTESALPAVIESPTEYANVAALEERIGAFLGRVEPAFDQHVADARKVWQTAIAIRTAFISVPQALKDRARRLLSDFKTKELQERRAEERRIAEAEQREAEQRRRAEAKLLERQGQPEAAQALRETPVYAPAVELPSAVPEVTGLSFREDWYWEPAGGDTPRTRAVALAMWVKEPFRQFVKIDDAALTAFAKRTKGSTKVPGIQFLSRQTPVRR